MTTLSYPFFAAQIRGVHSLKWLQVKIFPDILSHYIQVGLVVFCWSLPKTTLIKPAKLILIGSKIVETAALIQDALYYFIYF